MSYRRLFVLVLLLLVGAAVRRTRPVSAGDEWQPISPEELKMTSVPEAPGAPAVYLYRQVDRDDSNRTPHEYNYARIKILTEEGRKYADVEIPFFKEEGNIHSVKARTIRPDGSIVNFDGKAFDKTIVKAKGVKFLAKTFTLPDVQVGSIIEYHYMYDLNEGYVAGVGRPGCRREPPRRRTKEASSGWSRRIFPHFRSKTTCRRRTS